MIAKPPPLRRWAMPGLARRGLLASLLLAGTTLVAAPEVRAAEQIQCPNGDLDPRPIRVGGTGDDQPDLIVNGFCKVDDLGDYHFGNVNIVKGGKLVFIEPEQATDKNEVNFWAKSIIIEDGGLLSAGVGIPEHDVPDTPYGVKGNTLNFIIYGKDEVGDNFSYDPNRDLSKDNLGAACLQERCGVEEAFWQHDPESRVTQDNGVTDYFYMYHGLSGDEKPHAGGVQAGEPGYFGKKSLGLGYGGSLQLRGYKGTQLADEADKDPTSSGTSWIRLGAHLEKGKNALTLDREPTGWAPGDRIIVTTTDYVPAHTEEFTIKTITGKTIEFEAGQTAQYFHNGEVYETKLKDAPSYYTQVNGKGGANDNPLLESAETRAAVGLLTRSIRIVSGGDVSGEAFDLEPGQTAEGKTATEKNPKYQYGAHTVFRQGFQKLQVQGVEFRWLGQGGRLGHYPVHFHMARDVPDGTYIKDSSVNESMTRWMVLHATRGVTLQRNVGYKSIGHGYYLEDATEAENKLYANLGVMARAGVKGPLNPREVPGILAHGYEGGTGGDKAARARSDVLYPTVFWITNGWNDFVGNMAAGAGTCGTCYWLMPAGDNANMKNMKWGGYSELQHRMAGTSPLKRFYKNYCTSAMHAFNAVGSTSDCTGVATLDPAGNPSDVNRIVPVKSHAPTPLNGADQPKDAFYPNTTGDRAPTICSPSDDPSQDTCMTVNRCDYADPKDCATTVLDSYTTQFNWAETNFAAIWLRKGWNLVDRLFMSDIQNGGIGMVTGGDYTRSSVPLGFWSLLTHSVFVGETQPGNGYASPSGPKGPDGKTVCATSVRLGNACIEPESSVAYPLSNWSTNRMINIYDGPFYQEANAYLDIQPSDCKDFETCMYRDVRGVRLNKKDPSKGYLPNAAIGWKQPNGFYYPPAFDSRDLYFRDVAIRHYLTVPLFKKGTYMADPELVKKEFFAAPNDVPSNYFSGFTDIDRQTVLNDMDGTLTGFEKTISVNMDRFFSAPVQTPECLSNLGVTETGACAKNQSKNETTPTARTSPYDYVTTVVYPACASKENSGDTAFPCGSDTESVKEQVDPPRFIKMTERGGPWSKECGGPFCTGVRLYRQYLTDGSSSNAVASRTAAAHAVLTAAADLRLRGGSQRALDFQCDSVQRSDPVRRPAPAPKRSGSPGPPDPAAQ